MSRILSPKTLFLFYFIYFFTIPLGFLIRFLYTKTISVEEFGMIYAIIGFFNIISIFTNMGFSKSLSYFIPKFNLRGEIDKIRNLFYYTIILQLGIIVIFSVMIYFLSNFLSVYYFHNPAIIAYFKIFIGYYIFSNLLVTFSDIFVGYKMTTYYQGGTFLYSAFILLFSFLFFHLISGELILYYSYSWFFSVLLIFLFYLSLLYIKFPFLFKKFNFDRRLFFEYINYSFSIFLADIGLMLLFQTDIALITILLSLSDVAFYSNAVSLVMIVIGMFFIFSGVLVPIFSELKEKGDISTLNLILSFLYNFVAFLVLPVSLVFFLFPEQFLILIFGIDYVSGAKILSMLSLFSIISIFANYNLSFLRGIGEGKKLPKIIFPIMFFNLVFSIILIKYYGLIGVVIPTIISWFLLFVFSLLLIIKNTGFRFDYKKLGIIIFLNILFSFMVLYLKNSIMIINVYVNMTLILAFCYFIYIVLGYIFKIYSIKDLYVFFSEKSQKKIQIFHQKYFRYMK